MSHDMLVPLKTGFRGRTFNIPKAELTKPNFKPTFNKRSIIGGKGREWGSDVYKLLVQMGEREEAYLYMQPVDPVKHSEFYNMVREPLDLSKIQLNIHGGRYSELSEVCQHVFQMFQDLLMLYHDPGTHEHNSLLLVQEWFEQEVDKIRIKNGGSTSFFPRPPPSKSLSERIDAIEKHNSFVVGSPFILQNPLPSPPLLQPSYPHPKLFPPPSRNSLPPKQPSSLLSSLSSSSVPSRPIQKVIVSYAKSTASSKPLITSNNVNIINTCNKINASKSNAFLRVVCSSRDAGGEGGRASTSLNSVCKPSKPLEYVLLPRPSNNPNKLFIINPKTTTQQPINQPTTHTSTNAIPKLTSKNPINHSKTTPITNQTPEESTFSINIIDNSSTDLLILSFLPSIILLGPSQVTTDQPIVLTDEGFNVPWNGDDDDASNQLLIRPSDLLRCCLGRHGNQHILFLFFMPHFASEILSRASKLLPTPPTNHCTPPFLNHLVILTEPLNRQQSSLLLSFLYSFHHQSIFATSLFSELNQESVKGLLKHLQLEIASSSSSSSSSMSLSSISSNNNNNTKNKRALVVASGLPNGRSKSHTIVTAAVRSGHKTAVMPGSEHTLLNNGDVNGDAVGGTAVKQEPPDEDFLEFHQITNLPDNRCYGDGADNDAGNTHGDDNDDNNNNGGGDNDCNTGYGCDGNDNQYEGDDDVGNLVICNNINNNNMYNYRGGDDDDDGVDAGALTHDDDDYEYGKKKRKKRKGRKSVPKKKKMDNAAADDDSDYDNAAKSSAKSSKIKKSKLMTAYNASKNNHSATTTAESVSTSASSNRCHNPRDGEATETDSEKTNTVDEEEVYDDDYCDDTADDVREEKADVYLTYEEQSSTCPITQAPLCCPVKNPVCGHVYDKTGVEQLIMLRAEKARCPVSGCHNNHPLKLSHLIPTKTRAPMLLKHS